MSITIDKIQRGTFYDNQYLKQSNKNVWLSEREVNIKTDTTKKKKKLVLKSFMFELFESKCSYYKINKPIN